MPQTLQYSRRFWFSDCNSAEYIEIERYTEDVVVPNVVRVRRKSMADVVAMPQRIQRAAAQQESNLSTQWSYLMTRLKRRPYGLFWMNSQIRHIFHHIISSVIKNTRCLFRIRHSFVSYFIFIIRNYFVY